MFKRGKRMRKFWGSGLIIYCYIKATNVTEKIKTFLKILIFESWGGGGG